MVGADAREFVERVSELEPATFERMVIDALSETGRLTHVATNVLIGSRHADLTGVENQPGGTTREVVVEIKHRRAIDVSLIHMFVGMREALGRSDHGRQFLVIVSGLLTNAARREAQIAQLEIWDGAALAALVPADVHERYLGARRPRQSSRDEPPAGQVLAAALDGIAPGNAQWSDYQQLVAQIVEYLFVPPLSDMRQELPDADARNRRDIVLSNPATTEFWYRMRADYEAHYVIVDAKNYVGPLSKRPVLDIAHYLKPYGAGLFALLVSRAGSGPAGDHAIREQWIASRKMIVPLGDQDVRDMLQMRDGGGRPDEVIRKVIDRFRLGL